MADASDSKSVLPKTSSDSASPSQVQNGASRPPMPSNSNADTSAPSTELPQTQSSAALTSSSTKLSNELIDTLQMLDLLNSQIGVCGAMIVDQYHRQRQVAIANQQQQQQFSPPPAYGQQPQQYGAGYNNQYQQQPPAPNYGGQQPQQAPAGPPPLPPIVQDFASLANIMTQIQYDLFDIAITLAQKQVPDQIDSRIDDRAIQWLTDIITKISGQLPPHQDPILPIGNQIASNLYQAKTLCQQTAISLGRIPEEDNAKAIGEQQAQLQNKYLELLQSFLFAIFRWSNLVLGEKDWFWKPKAEMQQQAQQQAQQPKPQQGQQPRYQQPMQQPPAGYMPPQQPQMYQQPPQGYAQPMPQPAYGGQPAPAYGQPQPMPQPGYGNPPAPSYGPPQGQQPGPGNTQFNGPSATRK